MPLPLSVKGRSQARRAGIFLKKKNISLVFSSPQKRTQETAKIICQIIFKNKEGIIIDKKLRESGLGHFSEGLTHEDLSKKYPKVFRAYYREPAKVKAGGENLSAMAKRVLTAISKAVKKYPGKNLVFVSHQDPVLAALMKLSGKNFNELHQFKPLCPTGSVSEILFNGKKLINRIF